MAKIALLVTVLVGLTAAALNNIEKQDVDKVQKTIQAWTNAYSVQEVKRLQKGAQSSRGPRKSTNKTETIGKFYTIYRNTFKELTSKFSMNRDKALSLLREMLPAVCNAEDVKCNPDDNYRTVDGSCNNLNKTRWGSAGYPFHRLLEPAYVGEDDSPRGSDKELPNVRFISTKLHSGNGLSFVSNVTHMAAQWGQWIDHDITLTPVESLKCSDDPTISDNCWNIEVPEGDEFYGQHGVKLLDFVRSTPACFPLFETEHREQFNDITAFIDASGVYGSDNETFHILRSHKEGKLLENSEHASFLPWNPELIENGVKQVIAGDRRANEMPGLTTMHVLFLREHNRIATLLSTLTDWDDERLFQETRRIVGAELQQITYSEFLPAVLGDKAMKDYDLQLPLDPTAYTKYDTEVNPTIYNAFASAAYRFGHTLVNGLIELFSTLDTSDTPTHTYRVKDNYLISDQVIKEIDKENGITGYDQILNGLIRQRSQAFDREIHEDMINYLFMDKITQIGEDLAARNIQRGRDHGIPSYNEFRKHCKLEPLTDFNKTPDNIDAETWAILKEVYDSVDDIDLYTGGLSEIPVAFGLAGSTFVCLQGEQFKKLKYGDRFFFTHENTKGSFTPNQLSVLRKRTLSDIICENSAIKETPKNAFYVTSQLNPMLPCDKSRALDVSVFVNDGSTTTSTTPSSASKIASLSLYFLYTGICFVVFSTTLKLC